MALSLKYHAYYVDSSGKRTELPGSPFPTINTADAACTTYEAAHPGTGGYYISDRHLDQPVGTIPPKPVDPPKPVAGTDLIVTALSTDPAAPTVGQATKVTVKVKNQGTVQTPDNIGVGVGLFADGTQFSWVAPSSVIPGGTEVTLDTATAPSTGGPWTPAKEGAVTLKAVADDTLIISETDEGNNTKTISVTVGKATTPPPSTSTGKPFSSTSTWNTKIPANATYRVEPGLQQGGAYLNRDAYSGPVVTSQTSDPLVTMNVGASWGWPAQQIQLHMPSGQTGAVGTDGALVVIDGDTVWNFWQFTRQGPNAASCSAWAKTSIKADGWGQANPFQAAGIHAAGSSLLAGLIRGSELTDPAIGHTLALGIRRNLASSQHVGQAIYSDGSNGPVPEGTRVGIPRNVPKPQAITAVKQLSNLWDALVDYGGFIIDVADGGPSIYFWADPNSVPAGDAAAANGANAAMLAAPLQIVN